MTLKAIILDTTPVGLLAKPHGKPDADKCRKWAAQCLARGIKLYVPEVADYEVRRELLRLDNEASVTRLEELKDWLEYLTINTQIMQKAALLWATVRKAGLPTADPHALDGDVILCAQALTLELPPAEFIVATDNVKHLSRFVPADEWTNINP